MINTIVTMVLLYAMVLILIASKTTKHRDERTVLYTILLA